MWWLTNDDDCWWPIGNCLSAASNWVTPYVSFLKGRGLSSLVFWVSAGFWVVPKVSGRGQVGASLHRCFSNLSTFHLHLGVMQDSTPSEVGISGHQPVGIVATV